MALSTLSPPSSQPPPFTTHSSSAAALLSKLHHPSASAPFPANNHSNSLSTTTPHKWRANVSFFTGLLNNNKAKNAEAIKQELLEAIDPLDRGAEATPEDQKLIDQIARKLEAVNPTKEPLKSDLLNGKWELIYTTSQSILQTSRPKFLRSRTNYQAINADTLRAQNMESGGFFNQVTADLTPLNAKKVAVKFDYFKIGGKMKNLFGQLNYSMLKRSSLGVHSKKRIENRSSDEGERGKTVKLRKVKSGSRFGDLGRRPARSPAGCPGRRQREPPNLRASSARPNSPELVPTRPVPTQLDPTTNFHVVLEQLTISPWNNLMFMIYYGLVIEGRPWIQTKSKIKKEYPTVMYTAWTFWPVVGWINHQYVPLQFRVILQSTVACFWGIFLNLRAKSLTLPKK